ncbi:hypothetical protein FGO68_gene15157 [Halteria grandinella]|uniref:Uncharacterized protein n=1 Tax=Halteria grandinella TaxID=5974 RepID=A0A8J8T136_HALGN|nr:hypothetical protein FGO68_gene15157 [Halteria grandinella]
MLLRQHIGISGDLEEDYNDQSSCAKLQVPLKFLCPFLDIVATVDQCILSCSLSIGLIWASYSLEGWSIQVIICQQAK